MGHLSKISLKGCFSILVLIYIHLISIQPKSFAEKPSEKIPVYTYKIINTYPHDKGAFTEGLVFEEPFLYEGTGFYNYSSLRKVKIENGEVLKIHNLGNDYYGEGITIYKDKIIQLTWRSGVGFVYDKNTFDLLEKFYYSMEGWGITNDGRRLIMSDGTDILRFFDSESFKEIGQIRVFDNNGPVYKLNELEYIKGEVYANIWKSDKIARINPETGKVTGWINLEGLFEQSDAKDVLNGIAYDAKNDRLFVSGKLKPKLFEIQMVPTLD